VYGTRRSDILDEPVDRGAIDHVDLPEGHAAREALEKSPQERIGGLEVGPDDLVASLSQVAEQVRHHEPGGPRDQDGGLINP
jgi:hypothetical protein